MAVIIIFGYVKMGKSTLGRYLNSSISNSILLDADEMREDLYYKGFTDEDRTKWMHMLSNLAARFEKQGVLPIIAMVAPIRKVRLECMRKFIKPIQIFVDGTTEYMWKDSYFEKPTEEDDVIVYRKPDTYDNIIIGIMEKING